MDATETVAWIGAITGSIGTVTGVSALIWDLYKWKRQARPQLDIVALPGMMFAPPMGQFLPGMPGPNDRLVRVRVVNLGHRKTTLNILGLAYFASKPNRKMLKPIPQRFFVNNQLFGENLPRVLEPGEEWNGFINQNGEIETMALKGYLYALVEHTMGKTVYARVVLRDDAHLSEQRER
jgi:hypothetical protein